MGKRAADGTSLPKETLTNEEQLTFAIQYIERLKAATGVGTPPFTDYGTDANFAVIDWSVIESFWIAYHFALLRIASSGPNLEAPKMWIKVLAKELRDVGLLGFGFANVYLSHEHRRVAESTDVTALHLIERTYDEYAPASQIFGTEIDNFDRQVHDKLNAQVSRLSGAEGAAATEPPAVADDRLLRPSVGLGARDRLVFGRPRSQRLYLQFSFLSKLQQLVDASDITYSSSDDDSDSDDDDADGDATSQAITMYLKPKSPLDLLAARCDAAKDELELNPLVKQVLDKGEYDVEMYARRTFPHRTVEMYVSEADFDETVEAVWDDFTKEHDSLNYNDTTIDWALEDLLREATTRFFPKGLEVG